MKGLRTAVFLSLVLAASHVVAGGFPSGTRKFFNSDTFDVVAAPDGGVWTSTHAGLVRYTEEGPGVALPVPGTDLPRNVVVAEDGSIWFTTPTIIGRMSPTGTLLEEHAIANVIEIAIASDGALWYVRKTVDPFVGRIAGGVRSEFPPPVEAPWSLAPAGGGDVWLLGNGGGTGPDSVFRMTPLGSVTSIPLGVDVLYGTLQALPDGTLYIGRGYTEEGVLRLPAGSQNVEFVASRPAFAFVSDPDGNLWLGGHLALRYIARSGTPDVLSALPGDPSWCTVLRYQPAAIDSTGGVWIQVEADGGGIPEAPPCISPPFPSLIRVDGAAFLASHQVENIPTLSPVVLVMLGAMLALAAAWRIRT